MERALHPRRDPGHRWWAYERPEVSAPPAGNGHRRLEEAEVAAAGPPSEDAAGAASADDVRASSAPSGAAAPLAGAILSLVVMYAVATAGSSVAVVFVPVTAILLAVAGGRYTVRRRPDESWITGWLVAGVIAKLGASYLRYVTLVNTYEGQGDASGYHDYGVLWARFFRGESGDPHFPDLRRTNFVRWFTGVVYYVIGEDFLAGFLTFGLLAFVGSYAWFRATADAVPSVHKRLYLGLILFAPSVAFWPASIGKEALMQLGVGVFALGVSLALRRRLLLGLAIGGAGGWLVWVVRPHLLALLMVAGALAYFLGRSRTDDPWAEPRGGFFTRPIGLIAVGLLLVLAVDQGAKFLGIEELSLSSIEQELDAQTERSAQGGSEFDNGGNSLNPIYLPSRAVTVLLRPFPWETTESLQLMASFESVALALFAVSRFRSVKASIAQARERPFLLFCWALVALYAATFASFANFGLLVRQRSLVLPAVFAILCVAPVRRRVIRSSTRRRARPHHPSFQPAPVATPVGGGIARPPVPVVTSAPR